MRAPRLALPWYIHPAEGPREWAWLAGQNVSFAVVNVHNGPGGEHDAYYPQAIAGLGSTRLLGYVAVDYGQRPPADVARDVQAWQRIYGLDGIMFDELPSGAGSLDRCAEYAASARAAGIRFLAANPGVFPTPGHVRLFNVTSVFEGTAADYARFRHPAWAQNVPPARLWHLVHSCDPAQIAGVRLAAGHRGAGHAFVTDRSMPTPWLGPPANVSARLAKTKSP
ncbi:spherulation-specific family 4 protein [Arthrobacter sp. zg-Y750]|uniref:spherulation-specific family 4 protein n=1 Tax=Arthrobacter sp. zg-Y750 TaxID=2894189 RepID=UPI002F3F9F3E|nr:spherulation-specific family 4 protein [Arthrobacter sp. zg-Y750]